MRRRALPWIVLLSLAATTALATAAWAQAPLTSLEGSLAGLESITDLEFDQDALAVLAEVTVQDHPQLSLLIGSVEGVRARLFRLDAARSEEVRAEVAATAEALKAQGWITVVSVQGQADAELAYVMMQSADDRIVGLVGLFVGDDEVGFAQVDGDIDPAVVMATVMQNQGALRDVLKHMTDPNEDPGPAAAGEEG